MSDLFLESLDFEYIAAVFGVMASSERHIFQVLTKRPARMLEFFDWLQTQVEATERYGYDHPWPERALDGSWNEDWRRHETLNHAARQVVRHRGLTSGYGSMTWPLPNVWLGVSVEDQATAEERIPLLLKAPTAVPWVSYEPALGPVDFWPWANGLSWIVVGGESGRDARTFDMKWARDVVDLGERSDVNVNVFVKQMGANVVDSDASGTTAPRMPTPVPQSFKHIKGADPEEWEEGLRVQDWPRA
jgi:protein gp37